MIEQLLDNLAAAWIEDADEGEQRETVIAFCDAMSYTQLLNFSTMFTRDCLREHLARPGRLVFTDN
jgi:hypothetical protein